MKSQALFISTYPKQARIARELADEMEIPLQIYKGGIMRGGHLYACENQDSFDVIIAHGGGGAYLEKIVKKPVVFTPVPLMDMLDTFMTASSYGNPVTMLCYEDSTSRDFMALAKVVPALQCNFLLYSSKEGFEENLRTIAQLRNHTIIGMGNCIESHVDDPESRGLRFMVLESSREILRRSLTKAKTIIALKQDEQIKAERINGIMEHAIEGVLLLDKNACIKDANERAALLAEVPIPQILGRNILDKSLPPLFLKIFGDGTSVAGCKVENDGDQYVVNRINILLNEQCDETIITFYRSAVRDFGPSQDAKRLKSRGLVAHHVFEDIIADAKAMQRTILQAQRFSQTEAPILVEGETGTGKELLVQSIHNASARKNGPFVVVNCAALPDTLLESELFGYEEGAFTGARKGGKKGLFEIANNGTIFLDEISESSLAIQSRLLRVLQEKEVMRIGSSSVLQINARIVAATNKNLYALVQAGTFRKDLYFRLRRLKLAIPPLRERKEDIPSLVAHFIGNSPFENKKELQKQIKAVFPLLANHAWPGNVRELEHFIERLAILYDPEADLMDLVAEQLADDNEESCQAPIEANGDQIVVNVGSLKDMQRDIVLKLLLRTKGNKKHLADILKISRVTVWKMLK